MPNKRLTRRQKGALLDRLCDHLATDVLDPEAYTREEVRAEIVANGGDPDAMWAEFKPKLREMLDRRKEAK